MKRVSVTDIAAACGVSPSTVCRALNSKGDINSATRDKIVEACQQLGYCRNSSAGNLRLKTSNIIAGLMPDHDNELFIDKLHYLKNHCLEAGYVWQLYTFRTKDEAQRLCLEIIGTRPAGIVCGATPDETMTAALKANEIPAVCYDKKSEAFSCVSLNRQKGCETIVDHLLKTSRKRIILLGSPVASERGAGWRKAYETAGMIPDSRLVVDAPFGRNLYKYGFEQTTKLIAAGIEFDALFCVNDACAIGAVRALSESRVPIPESVAVAGFDNIMAAEYLTPPLTTLAQPIEEMAEKSIALLKEKIRDPLSATITEDVETCLILRKST